MEHISKEPAEELPAADEDWPVERLAALVFPTVEAAIASLPAEEREMAEFCCQSVKKARDSAYRNEGQIIII